MVVVTLTATVGKALAGIFFTGETVMTLMTVICGLILDGGRRLYFVALYPFNLTRRTRRQEQGVPYLCDLWSH
jgi:hypothetical protein